MSKYPIWRQNKWYGGFSDDKFLGIDASFQYAKGVEVRKNPMSIKLARPSVKLGTVEDLVLDMVTIKSTGDLVAFGDAGNIYMKSGEEWIKVYTDSDDRKILSAFEYNEYLYWTTAGHLHRISVADVVSGEEWEPTEDYKAFSVGNFNAHPMIELFNKLYIGDGYLLAELDSLGTFTADRVEVFNDEEIRSLTFVGEIMRIYSRKSNLADYGSQYLWDGASESYNERNMWRGTTIHCAITGDDGLDYVIAGRRPYIYVTSGYERRKLKRIPLVRDSEELFIAPNAIEIHDGLMCIGLAEEGDAQVGRGTWTYGKEDTKYPDSLNFEYPTSNDNELDVIGCVHQSQGVLYQSWKNDDGFGIDRIDNSKYRTSGELISRVLPGSSAAATKKVQFTEIAFQQLNDNESIEVQTRKNLKGDWKTEFTANYSDDFEKNERKRYLPSDNGDWNFLETRVILGSSGATSPEVNEITIAFNPEIEKGF